MAKKPVYAPQPAQQDEEMVVTVVRFRERPRLRPELPGLGAIVPSGAAVYLSRLRPTGAQYVVLEEFGLGGD